jgi:hypothetical protein
MDKCCCVSALLAVFLNPLAKRILPQHDRAETSPWFTRIPATDTIILPSHAVSFPACLNGRIILLVLLAPAAAALIWLVATRLAAN